MRRPVMIPLLLFFVRRTLLMWSLCGLIVFAMQLVICGIVHDNEYIKTFLQFLDVLPPFITSLIGGESLRSGEVSAFVAIGYQHPLVLTTFMVFAVTEPTGLLVGQTQRGTMELILSRAVTRWQMYVIAGMITAVGMFALTMVMYLGTVVAVRIFPFADQVPLDRFWKLALAGGLLAMSVAGITLLLSAVFRSRATAVGVAVAYLILSFFLDFITEWWPPMGFVRPVSLFYYVSGETIMAYNAWPLGHLSVLAGVFLLSALAGGIVWSRKDLLS